MAKRRRRRMGKRSGSRPFGFVKVKGRYALVFGSRQKPRLGKRRFKSRRALALHVRKKYMRR